MTWENLRGIGAIALIVLMAAAYIGVVLVAIVALFQGEYLKALAYAAVLILDTLVDIRTNTKRMRL